MKLFRTYPLLSRFTVFIVLPLLAAGVALLLYFQSSRAQVAGQLAVTGLHAAVTLSRDARGVLSIQAANDHDVYFAMGYAHAQDRLWQMEVQRRLAQGRLSEVFGKKTVRQDIWFRTLGLYPSAHTAWEALSQPARASLVAYADGVNAWLAGGATLPPEFLALGVKPAPWQPVDSLALVKVFALNLAGNMNQEIERFLAAQTVDDNKLRQLYADYPANAPVTAGDGTHLQAGQAGAALGGLLALQHQIEGALQVGGRYVGSNAWVVSGRLSQNGKAMLANDPHMSLQIPSLWYAVSQRGGSLDSSGMSLVGMPVIVFGKNASIAWGGTSMMADVQDLYFERVNGVNAAEYQDGDAWKKFEVRSEIINVKADFPAQLREALAPVKIQVRQSAHGVLVSDVVGAFEQPVALRWTGLDRDDTTYESFFQVNYAHDWASFKEALRFQVAPAMNMLYIDQADNIGYIGAGRIPVRARAEGQLPAPGWSGDYRWTGYIPFEQMPQSFNPERGYIVSANNKVAGADYPYFISHDWAPPARAERIEQMLDAGVSGHGKLSLAAMEGMQADLLNLEARQLLPLLTATVGRSGRQQQALGYLRAWNGAMSLDSQAASIYTAWLPHLRRQLFGPALSGYWNREVQQGFLDATTANIPVEALRRALTDGRATWCTGPVAGNCDDALRRSLEAALDELQKLQGADMAAWRWGDLHATRFTHMPFSDVKLLDLVYARRLRSGGAPATVNVANANFEASKGYVQTFGAAFRQIMQMTPDGQLFVNSTGQSGHPLSAHYDDMIAAFGAGRYYPLRATGTAAADVLTLTPSTVQGRLP